MERFAFVQRNTRTQGVNIPPIIKSFNRLKAHGIIIANDYYTFSICATARPFGATAS